MTSECDTCCDAQAVEQTKRIIVDSSSLEASTAALLQLQGLPEEERRLVAQMKEAAALVRNVTGEDGAEGVLGQADAGRAC